VKYINLHKINIFDLIILSVFSIYIIRNVFKFNTAYYIVSVVYIASTGLLCYKQKIEHIVTLYPSLLQISVIITTIFRHY